MTPEVPFEARGFTFDSRPDLLQTFVDIIPYTRTTDDLGRGEGSVIQIRINPKVREQIQQIVAAGMTDGTLPYRTLSDFTRDAVFKWFVFVSEHVLGHHSERSLFVNMETQISRLAQNLREKTLIEKVMQDSMPVIDQMVNARSAGAVYTELSKWVNVIKAQESEGEPYWIDRWVVALLSELVIIRGIRLLELDPKYANSETVATLRRWYDTYITNREAV